ncbi:2-dehydro-3-deoxy-D-gluconate 5-dehydrogenase KduD [Thiospirochaeta perfilievii]|uniref:2-dehydro-3-deoxy-D-gluconate 5-dehydrogenase n=1 Tax=Thiospirochaeta perfilievii TaxID=252967 RepID=A0A5C1QBT5_9SPIO|nr:2-dehydro-3-deoxy-D-gluconate 5-dehydrogenase KduD [Thiospirochaeta perfilievii]QEN04329.1 2-dehydro-3-deoxy-D-gluconate 5-dehydrogenase KduD [Thiospirochaeta perfilievii]
MILNSFNLEGKVAIVTGASRGLGQGVALSLAEAGCNIVGVSTKNSAETKKLVEDMGRKYLDISCDLTKQDKIPDVVKQSVETFGKIDILVNNSGIIRREDAINFTEQDWDDVMNVNLKSAFFFCQNVAKQFMSQGNGGKIINIASLLSYQGGIRVPSYTSSKGGIKGLTMALANEWASHNINVNGIAPGYMATDNTQALRDDEKRSGEILGRIPAGRWGKPSDIGGTAVFLASQAADYINGFTIAVDGGWLGR